MALPATDNFNRADVNPIGGNWTTIGALSAVQIVSNAAKGTNASGRSAAYWNADAFANDQYAQTVVPFTGGLYDGPVVRAATGAETYYNFRPNGASTAILYKAVAGTFTALGSGWAFVAGNTLKLSIEGTTLTGYINGVAQDPTQTDSALASGSAGIRFYGTGGTLDDFEAGNTEAGGASILPLVAADMHNTSRLDTMRG